jgi:hypothetical protein
MEIMIKKKNINNLINFKKILIISEVISNKIKKSILIKKNFNEKYEKTNKITLSGMNNVTDIKPVITYKSPFDKPIELKFKTDIDVDNLILEENYKSITFESNPDLTIDNLIKNINIYIDNVKELNPNIYQEFNVLIDKKNTEEIIFNDLNKYKIIEWNLELKKFFCLIWKILEKIYIEFNIFKKNISSIYINNNVLSFLGNELDYTDSNLRSNFNNFGKQINLIIIIFIGIKNIFDSADNDKNLLSYNTINIISDKYIFSLNYIIENLSIVTNLQNL